MKHAIIAWLIGGIDYDYHLGADGKLHGSGRCTHPVNAWLRRTLAAFVDLAMF